jgi:hypothetical protein
MGQLNSTGPAYRRTGGLQYDCENKMPVLVLFGSRGTGSVRRLTAD